MEFEVKIIEFLQVGGSDFWTGFFRFASSIAIYVMIAALFVVAFLICKKRFFLYGGCLGFGLLFNLLLKHIIRRDRPYVTHESIMQLGSGDGFSFPSLHSVCIAILAVFLCYFVFMKAKKKSTKILTVIIAVLSMIIIMMSRMYLGVHYLTDVIAGAFIGLLISVVAIIVYEKWIDKWLSTWKIFKPKEKNKDEEKKD